MKRWLVLSAVAAAVSLLAGAAPAATGPVADYRLFNSRASSVAGPPDLVDIGPGTNTFGKEKVQGKKKTVLKFPDGNGVQVDAVSGSYIPAGQYTIVAVVNYDDLSGWVRILDFKNGTSESGLYSSPSNVLHWWNLGLSGTTTLVADTYYEVTVTRDSAGLLTVYLDGNQEIQFDDSSIQDGFIDFNWLRFFRDNETGVNTEHAPGAVSRIQLFDHALSPSEVAALTVVPPKPTLKAQPTSGPPSTSVNLTGKNYGPNETVKIEFIDVNKVKTNLGNTTSDTPGDISKTVNVPAGAPAGVGKFQATGQTSGLKKTAKFTVT